MTTSDPGTEIALTPERLTEDFIQIALHDEYVRQGDALVSRGVPAPLRRWQLMLGANLVFYAVLCWQALPVLLACTFLVWWCGRRTAAKGTFYAGLAAALFPLLLHGNGQPQRGAVGEVV